MQLLYGFVPSRQGIMDSFNDGLAYLAALREAALEQAAELENAASAPTPRPEEGRQAESPGAHQRGTSPGWLEETRRSVQLDDEDDDEIAFYLEKIEHAPEEEVARLDALQTVEGVVMEVREQRGRLLVQGVERLVFFDEETILDGGNDPEVALRVGNEVVAVMRPLNLAVFYCTGIARKSRVNPQLILCYGVVRSVHEGKAFVEMKLRGKMCDVVVVQEALPQQPVMDALVLRRPPNRLPLLTPLEEFVWLRPKRTLQMMLREDLTAEWAGGAVLALDAMPLGEDIRGSGVVIHLEGNNGEIKCQSGTKQLVSFSLEEVVGEGAGLLGVGSEVALEACTELPTGDCPWRAMAVKTTQLVSLEPPKTPPASPPSRGLESLLEDLAGLDVETFGLHSPQDDTQISAFVDY